MAVALVLAASPLLMVVPRDGTVDVPPEDLGVGHSDGPDAAAQAPGALAEARAGVVAHAMRSGIGAWLAGPVGAEGAPWAILPGAAASPAGVDGLLAPALADIPRLPLPQPAAHAPVQAALARYAETLQVPLPALDLDASVAGLGLDPQGEAALAQLILAYCEAVALRREATAALTPQERDLVALDAEAVGAWLSADSTRTWADYEAEAVRIVELKTDRAKSLQAADLLARAMEAARGPLAAADLARPAAGAPDLAAATGPPFAGPWAAVDGFLSLRAHDALRAQPPAPPATLEEALAALRLAYGLPAQAPAGAALPPSLDAAVASIVAAKAWGLAVGDPAAEATAVVQAARLAQPTFAAWAALGDLALSDPAAAQSARAAAAGGPGAVAAGAPARAPVPGLPGPATRGGVAQSEAMQRFLSALGDTAADLPAPQREALQRGPDVRRLLDEPHWTEAEARLVQDWAAAHLQMTQPRREALRSLAAQAMQPSGACDPALGVAWVCAAMPFALAEGVPVPLPDGLLAPRPAAGPTLPVPGTLFDDSTAQSPSLLCWVQDGQCAGPASLLRVGGSGPDVYDHVSVIHIDLGGDDRYTTEVAGPASIAPRSPPPTPAQQPAPQCPTTNVAGTIDPTGACVPPRGCAAGAGDWACIPAATARGSHAIDYGGDDLYVTPALDRTQGSASGDARASRLGSAQPGPVGLGQADPDLAVNRAGASVLLDFDGDDTYAAGNVSQGAATDGGVGLLIDVAGQDSYAAASASQGAALTEGALVPGLAALLDLAGDDAYRFERQGSLVGSVGASLLFDAGGTDLYDSAAIPIETRFLGLSPAQTAPVFLTQGWLGSNATSMGSMGLALFVDGGVAPDVYLTRDLAGDVVDVSAWKNQQNVSNADGNSAGAGYFVDGLPFDPDDLRDHDRDGVPSILEDRYGSDRDDPASGWGNALHLLGDPSGADPQDPAGIDRGGAWLAPPRPSVPSPAGTLTLPGMVIAGRADDVHRDWAPFTVDLGGSDAYVAPFAGGMLPTNAGQGTVSSLHRDGVPGSPVGVADWPMTDVALLLDVGADGGSGDDTYAPDEQACTVAATAPVSLVNSPGDAAVRSPMAGVPTYVFPAACPSLGGAVNGIAILGDDGGSNTFRTTLTIDASIPTPVNAAGCPFPPCFVAQVAGYGATQGAGLFDGIGVLVTWDATNELESTVRVRAAETGTGAAGRPQATARGVSQGAGLGGLGVLAAFGHGNDGYRLEVEARAMQRSGADAGVAEGAGQGAGLSGMGILFDEGGANRLASPAGASQGFGSGLDLPANTLVAGAPATSNPSAGPAGTTVPGTQLAQVARPAVGILALGGGQDRLAAGPFSQGAAIGHRNPLAWSAATNMPNLGTAGVGLLLDLGGSDEYLVRPMAGGALPGRLACPDARCGLAQGAGAWQGLGLLLDGGGDDLYDAGDRTLAQGAGLLGAGLLDDQAGHDRYKAAARSQGYGGHGFAVLLQPEDQNATVTNGGSLSTAISQGTSTLQVADALPTLGMLVDVAGWDAYEAQARSQGFGEVLPYPAVYVRNCLAGQALTPSASLCSTPEQHCARASVAQGATSVYANDTCGGLPCSDTAAVRQCEDMANRRQCVGVPAAGASATQCVSTSTQVDCLGPCPTAVLGLLADAAGEDLYSGYGGTKCAADPTAGACAGDSDGNDWRWRQSEVPSGPASALALVAGLGADGGSLDAVMAALRGLLGQAPGGAAGQLPSVHVTVTQDPLGEQPLAAGAAAHGQVHLVATVQLRAPFEERDIDRVDLLVDGRLAGTATRVPGGPLRYVLPFQTSDAGDTAQQQRVGDGLHTVVASAFLSRAIGPAGHAARAGETSVESAPRSLLVDNAPILEADLDRVLVAPDLGQASTMTLRVSRDVAFPPGREGAVPGAGIRVTAHHLATGTVSVVREAYQEGAAPLELTLGGDACGGPCPDGRYRIEAAATDAAGHTVARTLDVVFDRQPPTSSSSLPAVANPSYRQGSSGLLLSWQHSDLPDGLAPGNASGVANVRVLRLAHDGSLQRDVGLFGPDDLSQTLLGVFSGDQVRILTVATDAVGHSESPCLTTSPFTPAAPEPQPCYRAKLLRPGGVQDTLLDYNRPTVSDLVAQPTVVAPGGSIEVSVRAADADSGLLPVQLTFSQGFAPMAMTPLGNGRHGATATALAATPGTPAAESAFVFTARATDLAGNERSMSGTGVLDSRAPRVTPLPTLYPGDGNETAATPGERVVVRARVQDAAVAAVSLDLGGLPHDTPPACLPDGNAANVYRCEVLVPAAEGEHNLTWTATDVAGNVNRTEHSVLAINGRAPQVMAVEVTAVTHEGFTVRWRTDMDGTSVVRYGRDNETELSATNQTCVAPALGGACYRDVHEVEVRGLPSATDFFVKALSRSRAGISQESPPLVVRTGHSYDLSFPGLASGQTLKGRVQVPVEVAFRDGASAPADIKLRIQDGAARATPLDVDQASRGPGAFSFDLDTTRLPDGAYRLLLAGSRSGDFLRVTSPLVYIDNTQPVLSAMEPRPASRTTDATPTLSVSVLDPLSPQAMALNGLVVLVNGSEVAPVQASVAPPSQPGAPQRLTVGLPALTDGVHRVEVRLRDAAGNLGSCTWEFTVDAAAPRLVGAARVEHLTGTSMARPDGRIRVLANVTDPSGVAGVRLALAAPVALTNAGGPTWTAQLAVPTGTPEGTWRVPLAATDALGNEAVIGAIEVAIDATPPALASATTQARGFTGLTVHVAASEPVTLNASVGPVAAHSLAPSGSPTVELAGLRPGETHRVTLVLVDRAGNRAQATVNGTTASDGEAPGAAQVRAESVGEGRVSLSWARVADNAGIASYRVERREAQAWRVLADLPPGQTNFTDAQAPAAALQAYRVTAIDVAGLVGPPGEALVRVLALPHLAEPSASPRAGDSAQRFTFQVLYRHASGSPPAQAWVEYGDLLLPLAPVEVAPDCRAGCLLAASARLPPAGLTGGDPRAEFVTLHDGHEARLALGWSPRVTAADGGLQAGPDKDAIPSPGAPALALALLAALALALRLPPPPPRT